MCTAAAPQLVSVQLTWEAPADGEGSAPEPDSSTRGQNDLGVPKPAGCAWMQAGGLRLPNVYSSTVKCCNANLSPFQEVATGEGREVQHEGPGVNHLATVARAFYPDLS